MSSAAAAASRRRPPAAACWRTSCCELRNLSDRRRETKISASIGIAVCPIDAATPDDLLKKADLALYHAKNDGRNCYHYYTAALDEVAHRKNADHSELRRCCGAPLRLAYQPILDQHGHTLAMEALLRLPGYLGREPVEYAIGLAGEMGCCRNWAAG
jgi:predicted signal transduction protein with EAL and GGDEF domain